MGFVLVSEDGFLCSLAWTQCGLPWRVRAVLLSDLLYHTASFLSTHVILALQDDAGPLSMWISASISWG